MTSRSLDLLLIGPKKQAVKLNVMDSESLEVLNPLVSPPKPRLFNLFKCHRTSKTCLNAIGHPKT